MNVEGVRPTVTHHGEKAEDGIACRNDENDSLPNRDIILMSIIARQMSELELAGNAV
jgi:hypothetical protein